MATRKSDPTTPDGRKRHVKFSEYPERPYKDAKAKSGAAPPKDDSKNDSTDEKDKEGSDST